MENMCKEDLMKLIRTSSFAIVEMALYLDTHPDCVCGLETYHEYKNTYESALACYEKKYGPLTIYGVENDDYWCWSKGPWPWQKECE